MDPERRELLRVILNDDNAVRADEMFTILMGAVAVSYTHLDVYKRQERTMAVRSGS